MSARICEVCGTPEGHFLRSEEGFVCFECFDSPAPSLPAFADEDHDVFFTKGAIQFPNTSEAVC